MRRIKEKVNPPKILEIGTRAVCREELDYAKESGIEFLTASQIREHGTAETIEALDCALADCERIYLTIDLDVLDPAFAPAVQNPEPEGLGTSTLLDLLEVVCSHRVSGFDLVEVAPQYDRGMTAIQAAKIIFEMLCCLERTQKS
jgi:agmatinase